jgi:Mor family transcriptional regulator
MTILDRDFVRDVLQRVLVVARGDGGLTADAVRHVEKEVRADWGGDMPYIAKGRADCIAERNDKIMAVWDSGQRDIRELALRFALSPKQIYRIVRRPSRDRKA